MRFASPLLCACLFALPPAAQGAVDSRADPVIRQLLDHVFLMEFDRAEQTGQELVALDSQSPYGAFGLMVVALTRYIYETEQTDQSILPTFEQRVEESIRRAKEYLRAHPNDAEALMVLGASYGLASRMSAVRHEWINAYFRGRAAIQYVRAAVKADPELGDPWLGIGMYDYYTDTYPRFIGVLAKLVFRGNRRRGIEALHRAAERGRYVSTAAKLILVEIYTEDRFGALDPKEAVRIITEVRAQYPQSLMIHAAELVSLYEARRLDEALASSEAFMVAASSAPHAPVQLSKGRAIRGCILWAMGRHAQAEAELLQGARERLGERPTRWGVWSRIRLGHLLDVQKRRVEAEEHYRLAAAEPNYWDLRQYAKEGLSRPWKDAGPGHIPPI
ncbi:MAG: hypothetical protein WC728_17535 [Elusimicrobiota bacterium]